jgi:Cep192 domain 4/Abnormal spindle-like microcephaly-assoc'd, ASPM-SPD-2-Hydin/HYDIN/CFA65/VesB-like, Ig-like domain
MRFAGAAMANGVGVRQRPASPRSAIDSIFLSTILLCTGILGGCAGMVSGSKTATTVTAFQVSPTSLNFGNVAVGKPTTQTIAVTNTGSTSVTITQAVSSNPAFSLTGVTLPMTMAAGQTGSFTIAVTPSAAGALTGTLTVQSSSGAAPAVVNLSATAVATTTPQVSVSSSSVQFGTVGVSSTSNLNLTISNTGTADLTISVVSLTGAEFSVSGITTPKTITAGQSAAVSLSFKPTAAGAATGTLTITSNDPVNPTMSVALAGTGSSATFGQLQANPTSLSFGSVSTGGNATQKVTLSNTGTAAVQISNIAASGAGFSVNGITAPFTLNAAATATLNVVFAPTARGSATGSVTVTSNANNSPLAVSLAGTGAQPALSITPASANFGSVAVGSTNSQTIKLTNTGTSVLTMTQANVTGTGFSTTGLTLPLSINPGLSSTFNAQYQPTAVAASSGSITIVSNAATSPSVIALSGTGVAATLTISLSTNTVSFGNVNTGTSSTQPVTVTNTGNSNVQISQIAASGTGYTLSGASAPVTLTPSQKLTFNVIFTPTVTGATSGSVTITSNATGSPSSISLSGSGVVAVTHTVSLSWAASTSSTVTGYYVYRSTTNGSGYAKLIGTPQASVNYTDSAVTNGTTYYYVTTAVDGSGNESAFSNQATAVIP